MTHCRTVTSLTCVEQRNQLPKYALQDPVMFKMQTVWAEFRTAVSFGHWALTREEVRDLSRVDVAYLPPGGDHTGEHLLGRTFKAGAPCTYKMKITVG